MGRTIWILTKHAWLGFTRDNCSQLAAAIAYYVLFSIVPLAIFTVSVFGFVLNRESVRTEIVDRVLDVVPLNETDGRSAVEDALNGVKRVSGPVAALALVGTLWTASAVFSSIRKSLNVVWDVDEHRPYAQAKLVDFAQVGMLTLILLLSLVATGVLRAIREVSAEHVGPLANESPLWELPPILLPALLSYLTFALLYRLVPAVHPRWRDALPGALFATILFEALKNSFAIYVANFANFDVVYGSLAGLLLFLLYTFLASNILLAGAEVARVLERYHDGEFDPEISPDRPRTPMTTLALRALRGLFVRE